MGLQTEHTNPKKGDTPNNGESSLTMQQIHTLEALERNKGNISAACKAVGISRTTWYNWRSDVPGFAQAVSDAREALIDMVEGMLVGQVEKGQGWAICFFLKTQAKHRGYSESPLTVNIPRQLGNYRPGVDSPLEYIRKALASAKA